MNKYSCVPLNQIRIPIKKNFKVIIINITYRLILINDIHSILPNLK